MPKNHHVKKSTRQKKLIKKIETSQNEEIKDSDLGLNDYEKEVVEQYNVIKSDYTRLIKDVVKEFKIVKVWMVDKVQKYNPLVHKH